MLRRVALVRTEFCAKVSVLTRATQRNIPEDGILNGEMKIIGPSGTRTPTHKSSNPLPVVILNTLSWTSGYIYPN
jgi:hypothetical protein